MSQPGSARAAAAGPPPTHFHHPPGGCGSQPGSARSAQAAAEPHLHPGAHHYPGSQPGSATAAAAVAAAQPPELGGGSAGFDPEGGSDAAAAAWYGGEAGYGPGGGGGAGLGAAADAEGGAAAGSGQQQQTYEYAAGGGGEAAGAHASTAAAGGDEVAEAAADAGAAGAYDPAAYLAELEAYLAGLQEQRRALQSQLAAAAAAAYQDMSARLGTAGTGVPLPSELPALAGELATLGSLRQYLAYVQELQALTRHAEKAVRALQQQQAAAGGGGGDAAFLRALAEAVDGFSSAVSYAIAVKQLMDDGKVPIGRLRQYAAGWLARVDAAQAGLRALLSGAIQARLAAAHWPPSLAVSGEGGAAAGPGGDPGAVFCGFEAAGGQVAAELTQLLTTLTTLQRAAQHERFAALGEASQEGPLLWAAEELAAPLAQRLRHHFAGGLPTDRPDRPEWLFATALKAAQQCAPLAQELQPCVDAHQLQGWYSMPLELARAVQVVGVNAILADHLLPQLVTAGGPALWLHLADEAMAYEKRFAPLRGAGLDLPEDEGFLAAAHPGSALELLLLRPDWQEGWLGAEAWDAQRQLEGFLDAYAAWQPAGDQLRQLAAAAGEEDLLAPETPRSRGGAAWRREFWPPVCAEQAAGLVHALVRRGGWLHAPDSRLRYMQAVPLAVLKTLRERLSALLQQAEQFRGLLGDTWLPRVGAAVCGAHHLEHALREPQGVLLLVELLEAPPQASAAPPAAEAGAGAEHAEGAEGAAAAAGSGAAGAPAAAAASPGRLAALVEREAAAYGALRRQWAYKLAKAAVDAFHQLFAPYKRDAGAFTAGWEDGMPAEAAAAAAAAAGAPAPSPAMLLAADSLQQLLRALAQHLDAVVFRDVWRAVALAVNYSLYNEVATEALFSPQGAAQLDADLSAIQAVFGEYTSRPAAHFRESREAARLLGLALGEAGTLLAALEAQPRAAKVLLAPHGVKALNAEQAAVVLLQRLDLLMARGQGSSAAAAAAVAATAAQPAAQPAVQHVAALPPAAGSGYAGGGIEV